MRIKRAAVKDLLCHYKADIGLLQETKLSSVSQSIVKEILGAITGDNWICCDAVGSSGGILVIWNKRMFVRKDFWVGKFLASALLEEISSTSTWIVTSIYDPNDCSLRDCFRSELDSICNRWSSPWFIGGDWNVVRLPFERSGCNSLSSDMISFSDWIN